MQADLEGGLLRSDFVYFDLQSGRTSASLHDLVRERGVEFEEDPHFFELYENHRDTWPRTPVTGIVKQTRPSASQPMGVKPEGSLASASGFEESLRRSLLAGAIGDQIHIALSGGLDAQLLCLLARDLGLEVRAFSLVSEIENYDESSQVRKFCGEHHFALREWPVTRADFTNALGDFVRAVECPLYNLHPVSKWLMAKKLAQAGITRVVSGDGADQLMRGQDFCDLFFLTKRSFAFHQVELATPLATSHMQDWVSEHGPFIDKEPLREWAFRQWGLAKKEKRPSFFPDLFPGSSCLQVSRQILEESLCAQ